MNEQPKNKILIIIIGLLLVANVVMLGFFLWNNHAEKKERALERDKSSRSKFVADYLKNEVGFNNEQLVRYDSISKKHREQLKAAFGELAAERKKTFASLAAASFTDSAMNNAANEIHERQRVLELSMLKHLKEIRNLCTAEQVARFDTGFYKIFGRRGETRKEK